MRYLREKIENSIKKIKEIEKKNRCNQYSNSNGCCHSDYVSGSKSEIKEILEFLEKNEDIKKRVLENLKNDKKCFFHDKISRRCLIEAVRPLSCRYVAYKIYEHGDVYKYCSPICSCKKNVSTILESKIEKVKKFDEEIYEVKINNENFYFLNCKKIVGFNKYIEEEKIKLKDILEEKKC